MTKIKKFALGFVSVAMMAFAGAATAAPILVDFEGFTTPTTSFGMGGSLTMGSVIYNSVSGAGNIEGNLRWPSTHATQNGTARYQHQVGSAFTLDTVDGSLFSLTSFDFAERRIDNGFQAVSTIVTGTYGSGGTISATFTVSAPGFQSFTLGSGWTGLTLISFANPGSAFCTPDCVYYDNILLNTEAPSGVPAPGALALLGLGLLGIAGLRRRKAA